MPVEYPPNTGTPGGATPSQAAAIDANTAARHTHANKATLDDTTAAYTSAEKTKLGNMTDSFKGVFANQAAIEAAYPTTSPGWCAWNTATSTIWSVVSGAWVNSGISSIGDMLKAVYDPQSVAGDAFSRAKHTGSQAIATVTGLQTALDARVVNGQSAAVAFAGTLGADGFCRIGNLGPSIKMKLMTGTMPALGASIYVPHGLTQSKIISADCVVVDSAGNIRKQLADPISGVGYSFRIRSSDSSLWLTTGAAGSDIVGGTYKVLLMYTS